MHPKRTALHKKKTEPEMDPAALLFFSLNRKNLRDERETETETLFCSVVLFSGTETSRELLTLSTSYTEMERDPA